MEAVLWREGTEMGAKSVCTFFCHFLHALYITPHLYYWCYCVRYDRIPLTDSDVEEELKDAAKK